MHARARMLASPEVLFVGTAGNEGQSVARLEEKHEHLNIPHDPPSVVQCPTDTTSLSEDAKFWR